MPYGENGFQLAGLMYQTVHTMNNTMMASLIITIISLVFFVWLMPMDSTVDDKHDRETRQVEVCGYAWRSAVCRGQFNWQMQAETFQQFVEISGPSGRHGGRLQCVFQIKSQPITNAISSPNAKYAYEYAEPDTWCYCSELRIAQSWRNRSRLRPEGRRRTMPDLR